MKGIPPQLKSLDGISIIAYRISQPIHMEKSMLYPFHFGDTKVKVEITLDVQPSSTVIVRDSLGYSVKVDVVYPRFPPQCCNCEKFGHLLNYCPEPLLKKRFQEFSQDSPTSMEKMGSPMSLR